MLMVVKANAKLPALTAQDVGRELYHGRQAVVQIVGDRDTLETIDWIFQKVPDMFDLQLRSASLIVRCAKNHYKKQRVKKEVTAPDSTQSLPLVPVAH